MPYRMLGATMRNISLWRLVLLIGRRLNLVREIEHGEVMKEFAGSNVISTSSIFDCVEDAKIVVSPPSVNLRRPLPRGMGRNTPHSGAIGSLKDYVRHIFTMGRVSQVRSAVVQLVAVNVVNFSIRESIADNTVHEDGPRSISVADFPSPNRIAGRVQIPVVQQDAVSVFGINHSKGPFRQGNKNRTVIGRNTLSLGCVSTRKRAEPSPSLLQMGRFRCECRAAVLAGRLESHRVLLTLVAAPEAVCAAVRPLCESPNYLIFRETTPILAAKGGA